MRVSRNGGQNKTLLRTTTSQQQLSTRHHHDEHVELYLIFLTFFYRLDNWKHRPAVIGLSVPAVYRFVLCHIWERCFISTNSQSVINHIRNSHLLSALNITKNYMANECIIVLWFYLFQNYSSFKWHTLCNLRNILAGKSASGLVQGQREAPWEAALV